MKTEDEAKKKKVLEKKELLKQIQMQDMLLKQKTKNEFEKGTHSVDFAHENVLSSVFEVKENKAQ